MSGIKGSIGIVGASGFIGRELARQASDGGWKVVGFSRSERRPGDGVAEWRKADEGIELNGLDVVVNLAGESIVQRWTEARKRRFRESRVDLTRWLVEAIARQPAKPLVLLNSSAVGYYGDRGDDALTEAEPAAGDFLARLCVDWEAEALKAEALGVRVLLWRTGVVLGKGGGAWEPLRRVFSLGIGGQLGDGRQWMPWIHLEDLVGGMLHAIEHGMSGPVNGTAPEPERNADFTRKVAAALKRPALIPVPGWAIRLGLGGFGGFLLASERAVPRALEEAGYRFRHPRLEEALAELTGG